MRSVSTIRSLLAIVFIFTFSPCFSAETKAITGESGKYLDAVREFADNVLKYGRDTYGPKRTPLFVDGLNIHTREPVKWIDPDGTKWILSNFNSQQTLLRTLDGLSSLTGDLKYRDAAKAAIAYAFENLRSPNGLFYWGHVAAYDASADKVRGSGHCLKLDYPHYDLFWTVDPNETVRFIEAYWSAHVRDWRNLNFNRSAPLTGNFKKPWNHTYDEKSPTFYKTGYRGFFVTATSLVHAGTTLYRMSYEEQPLIWSKRLIRRFVDTRHPNTGIGTYLYNTIPPRPPLGDDLKQHFQNPRTMPFPFEPFEEIRGVYYPKESAIEAHQTVSLFGVGESLGEEGKQFTQWALEELTAWGKASYRKRDNAFVPILTDGTSIEGYVLQRSNSYGPKGAVAEPRFADLSFFWAYAVGYGTTGDAYMWEITRDIALGNSLGDIGKHPEDSQELETDIHCSDVYGLLGFLELYEATGNPSFLHTAKRIANNMVENQFHKGFFVPSEKHIYTRFDCFEPLALLHLVAAIERKSEFVPKLWPSCPLFARPYRYKQEGVDRWAIYALTESPELPFSLQEAAAAGDIELVRSLLQTGVGIDSWDDSLKRTALQQAAIKGHKDVVELLLNKGARIEAQEDFPGGTALDYAAEYGHEEVVELLIAKGADIHARREGYPPGDTPLHSAVRKGHQEVVRLLLAHGADIDLRDGSGRRPLVIAIFADDKDMVELLIRSGADVNLADGGNPPLLHAVIRGNAEIVKLLLDHGAKVYPSVYIRLAASRGMREMVELFLSRGVDSSSLHMAVCAGDLAAVKSLIAQGGDVNAKDEEGWTPLFWATCMGRTDVIELLIDEGADVTITDNSQNTALHKAVELGNWAVARVLIDHGADINAKGRGRLGLTPLHLAVPTRNKEMIELLVRSGADMNIKNFRGLSPLDVAKARGLQEIVELLNKLSTEFPETPKDDTGVVGQLLTAGATVSARQSVEPHKVSEQGDVENIRLLLADGADVSIVSVRAPAKCTQGDDVCFSYRGESRS